MRSEGECGGGGYLAGARAVLSLALATGVMGISFGVLAYSLNWGVVAPIVFSVITFSGTAQFAVASVLVVGGLVGGVVGDVEQLGLDVIFPAFYLTLLVEDLRGGGQTIAVVLLAVALA